MLQDIFPHEYHNEFRKKPPEPEDLLLIYSPAGVLSAAEGLALPCCGDFPALPVRYAFSLDERGVYLAQETVEAPPGWRYVPSGEYRLGQPRETAFACAVGESLHRWYQKTRFCGACGVSMEDSAMERARLCPKCGNTVYPRINPAVIVAVTHGDELLLTRYANRPFRSYALIAGFCEIGETLEETVHREVLEEVGLRVKNLRFYKSQPWVLTDSLLMGFYCEVEGKTEPVLQDGELAEAQWFHRGALPNDHSGISLTGEMIQRFRAGKEKYILTE